MSLDVIDLTNLKEYDLRELYLAEKQIDREILSRLSKDHQAERRKMEKQVQKLADTLGMKLVADDEMDTTEEKPGVIYRNPNDPSQVWRVGGRKPKWVKDLEEVGQDIQTLEEKPRVASE